MPKRLWPAGLIALTIIGLGAIAASAAGVRSEVDVAITKDVAPAVAGPSDTVTYTLEVVNNGPSTAPTVRAADPLPDNLEFVSATTPVGQCSHDGAATGGTVACELGSMLPDAPVSISIEARVASLAPGQCVLNTASAADETEPVVIDNPDPEEDDVLEWVETDESNNSDDAEVCGKELKGPDLDVVLVDDEREVDPDEIGLAQCELFTYSVTIVNMGDEPSPQDLEAVLTLPPEVTLRTEGDRVECPPSIPPAASGQQVRIPAREIGVIQPNGPPVTIDRRVQVLVDQNNPIWADVVLSTGESDVEPTRLRSRAPDEQDLHLGLVFSPDTGLSEGDRTDLIAEVGNRGAVDAAGVVAAIDVPPGLTVVAAPGTFDPATGRWSIGDLPIAEAKQIPITVTIDRPGTHTAVGEIIAATRLDDIHSVYGDGMGPHDYDVADLFVQAALVEVLAEVLPATGLEATGLAGLGGAILAVGAAVVAAARVLARPGARRTR